MKHKVENIKLGNGSEGLLIHVPDATVMSYELNFRAGEYLVDKNKWEAPHLMEHVILGANKSYPDAKSFQAEFSKNGAYTNAYTSYYSVSYVGESADFEWERVLKMQLLALSEPLFTYKEFKAEWGNIRDELTSYCNNHLRVLGGKLEQAFGLNGATDEERIALMKNIKRADLVTHYKKTHFTKNLRFIIAGNLHARKSRISEALEIFKIPKGDKRFDLPAEKAHRPRKPVFIPNESVKNIYLYIDSYSNSILNEVDDAALSLARIMLTDTLHSKIFGSAREQGLVYSVNSNHHRLSNMTNWWLSAQVLPINAPALSNIIVNEIKKVIRGDIDDADIEAAKQYALGSLQRSLQTVGSVVGAYSRYFFDEYIQDINALPEQIKAVTKQQMSEAMARMFSESIGGIGVLGGDDPSIAKKLNSSLSALWR